MYTAEKTLKRVNDGVEMKSKFHAKHIVFVCDRNGRGKGAPNREVYASAESITRWQKLRLYFIYLTEKCCNQRK